VQVAPKAWPVVADEGVVVVALGIVEIEAEAEENADEDGDDDEDSTPLQSPETQVLNAH
jgi:hypothetical protein